MYLRIMRAMSIDSQARLDRFKEEYVKAVNRFTVELLDNFAADDYSLDWEKLLEFNSSVTRPRPSDWVRLHTATAANP